MATREDQIEEAREEAEAAWNALRSTKDRSFWADYEEAASRLYRLEAELRALNEELDAANGAAAGAAYLDDDECGWELHGPRWPWLRSRMNGEASET